MRTKQLNSTSFNSAQILSKAELKNVMGGRAAVGFTCDWTCTTSSQSIHLGTLSGVEANDACPPWAELSGEDCQDS